MTYNGKELAAMLNLGIAMAQADGHFAESEQEAIAIELVKFGVSADQLPAILAASTLMSGAEAISTLSAMSDSQKKYACGYFAVIMAVDGDIKKSELEMWRLICTLGKFPEMNVHEALTFWNNN